jgi:hypothetical protein
MYTEPEVNNRQTNNVEQMRTIILSARALAKLLKPFDFGEYNKGLKMAEEMIIRGFCTIYMAHMNESDFEEMLTNTLAYFATGLYDCEKISGIGYGNAQTYNVCGWRYTPETHNDAGYWFDIWKFEKDYDAEKCVAMLKAIGAELDKLQKNY